MTITTFIKRILVFMKPHYIFKMAAPIPSVLKYSIVYNLLNVPPILLKFVSEFIVCKNLYFKAQYLLGLHSPLMCSPYFGSVSRYTFSRCLPRCAYEFVKNFLQTIYTIVFCTICSHFIMGKTKIVHVLKGQ